MAQKFTVPITVKQLSSASSDAVTVFVDQDTYARLKLEAGGRLTWGDGTATGDVNLYRDGANVLRTDDTFKTPTLFVDSIEIDPTGATTDQILKFDGTKFVASTAAAGVTTLDGLSDVVITSPAEFQTLQYDGTNWVNSYSSVVSYVQNAEATTLTTGTAVYLFGATGDHASVKRADNNSDATSAKTVGLVGAPIAASQNGPVITRGYVDGINLSVGYSAGDILWLGENGAFTKVKPTAPDHLVFIGVVVRATNNGIVYVATQNGYELDELHNVSIPSPNAGEVLKYDGSLWVSASVVTSLDHLSDVALNNGSVAVNDFLKYDGTNWINDQINLGIDTTGNFVSEIFGGTGVTVNHTPGEGSSASVSIGQNVATSASVTFLAVTSSFHGDVTGQVSDLSNHVLNDLSDVNLGVSASGNFLKYDGTEWIAAPIPEINEIDDIGDVTVSAPTVGQILAYNGSVWVNQDNSAGVTNLDGGTTLIEIYEAEITNKVEAVYDGGTL